MKAKDIYKIWYEKGGIWKGWIRPVPFIGIDIPKTNLEIIDYSIPKINYLNKLFSDTAIIIDDFGVDSIKEGIALANLGFIPIPIFNGTNPNLNSKSTTNNSIIEPLLVWGALQLKNIKLEKGNPPVFLLDSNRLNRYKISRGIFDNSWDVYSQDLPTHDYLKNNNITKIIIRSNKINKDLSKILYKYQKNNIDILFTNGYEEPKKIRIKKNNRK